MFYMMVLCGVLCRQYFVIQFSMVITHSVFCLEYYMCSGFVQHFECMYSLYGTIVCKNNTGAADDDLVLLSPGFL